MKKCHIGFLAPTVYRYYQGNGFGGAELQIVQFARMFAEAGYPVTIITNDYGQKEEEIQNGIRIVKIPLRFLGGNNLFFFWDCLVFLWKFRQLKLDYCLMKNPNSVLFLPGLAKIFCPRLKSFKIFASNGDCKIPSGFSGLLYRLGIKLSDGFIFQTETQKQESQKTLKIQGTVISNIFYPPIAEAAEKKDYDVLWVGGFNNMKCPEKFYQIAKALPQYRFAMIAKPCPESYLALQEQIQALPNVDYLGTVPFEQTQSYFNRARLYLCTSAVEGFPNTFLQSWYARIPVVSVSFPCDGVLERFQCGLLSRTVEKCCNDISLCLENQQYCDIMGRNGFEYLEKNHLPSNLLQKMEEFLNKH